MGLGIGCSSCSCIANPTVQKRSRNSSPSPKKFRIERVLRLDRYSIVQAHYDEATNFEGEKLMLYKDVDRDWFDNTKELDPHFCDTGTHPSPIARFEPTGPGLEMAMELVMMLCDRERT